jgi:hypothetical protein
MEVLPQSNQIHGELGMDELTILTETIKKPTSILQEAIYPGAAAEPLERELWLETARQLTRPFRTPLLLDIHTE